MQKRRGFHGRVFVGAPIAETSVGLFKCRVGGLELSASSVAFHAAGRIISFS